MDQKIFDAVERFASIVTYLECECDETQGYTCTIHADRRLAKEVLDLIGEMPRKDLDYDNEN